MFSSLIAAGYISVKLYNNLIGHTLLWIVLCSSLHVWKLLLSIVIDLLSLLERFLHPYFTLKIQINRNSISMSIDEDAIEAYAVVEAVIYNHQRRGMQET